MTYTIHEAKTHLSKLIQNALAGEVVVIAHDKTPVVTLNPIPGPGLRVPNLAKGEVWMADDFDAPLDDFKEYR